MDIGYVFEWMRENRGLDLPYGLTPGHGPGRGYSVFDRATWAAWQWNPPVQYMNDATGTLVDWDDPPFTDADPSASEKPTWDAIMVAKYAVDRALTIERLRQELDDEEERRICAAYGQTSVNQEVFYRLRAMRDPDTSKLDEQDAERNRLHRVRRRIESLVDEDLSSEPDPGDGPFNEIFSYDIDLSDDDLWAPDPVLTGPWLWVEAGEPWVDFGFTPFGATVTAGAPAVTMNL